MTIPDQSTEAFFARVNEDKIQALKSQNDTLKYEVRRYRAALEDIATAENAPENIVNFAEAVLETPTAGVEVEFVPVQALVDQAIERLDSASKEEFRQMCIRAGYTPTNKAGD